jgi:hypothetical protein
LAIEQHYDDRLNVIGSVSMDAGSRLWRFLKLTEPSLGNIRDPN